MHLCLDKYLEIKQETWEKSLRYCPMIFGTSFVQRKQSLLNIQVKTFNFDQIQIQMQRIRDSFLSLCSKCIFHINRKTAKMFVNSVHLYCIFQLYEIDDNPKRREFLYELFAFMQKRGESSFLYFELRISYTRHNVILVKLDTRFLR